MEREREDIDLNFNIMVLDTNFWPLDPPNDFIVLPEIQTSSPSTTR